MTARGTRHTRADRTVHAFTPDMEVVRYDRSGKWYLEPRNPTLKRQQVTIQGAVDYAIWAWTNVPGSSPVFGKAGGTRFDYLVRTTAADDEVSDEPTS